MDRTTARKIIDIMAQEGVSESTARRWLKDGRRHAARGPGAKRKGQGEAAQEAVRAYAAGEIGLPEVLEISGLGLRTIRRRTAAIAAAHGPDAATV